MTKWTKLPDLSERASSSFFLLIGKWIINCPRSMDLKNNVIRLSWGRDKEKVLSSHEELNLRRSDLTLPCSTSGQQRTHWWVRPLLGSCVTPILHTAKISYVESIAWINRITKMVKFLARLWNKERCFEVSELSEGLQWFLALLIILTRLN